MDTFYTFALATTVGPWSPPWRRIILAPSEVSKEIARRRTTISSRGQSAQTSPPGVHGFPDVRRVRTLGLFGPVLLRLPRHSTYIPVLPGGRLTPVSKESQVGEQKSSACLQQWNPLGRAPDRVSAILGWGQSSPTVGAKEARAAWYSSGVLMSRRGIAVGVSTTWVSARWRWRTARRP